jgi:hypothetical protein
LFSDFYRWLSIYLIKIELRNSLFKAPQKDGCFIRSRSLDERATPYHFVKKNEEAVSLKPPKK